MREANVRAARARSWRSRCSRSRPRNRRTRTTIEERVAALESGLATLETRFGLQSTRLPTSAARAVLALAGRVTALERSLERLAVDVQRVERVAETAARDAATAQREPSKRLATRRCARVETSPLPRGPAPARPRVVGALHGAQVLDELVDRVANRALRDDVAALLDPELVTPDRHRARAVRRLSRRGRR